MLYVLLYLVIGVFVAVIERRLNGAHGVYNDTHVVFVCTFLWLPFLIVGGLIVLPFYLLTEGLNLLVDKLAKLTFKD